MVALEISLSANILLPSVSWAEKCGNFPPHFECYSCVKKNAKKFAILHLKFLKLAQFNQS
ncbi:hypothetical protein C3Z13_08810 [Avibacterium endocarditidis]|uniref:Uncharacterized protein n=1 Tax=Avibacterium endocarditidis TaxID=380674 RepID=A0ABX4ZR44_9PAST|nr:hypothetical protein C3Z13_08810 [Avibacterium endocarditidis]